MNYKQASKIVKNNYPPENYALLRQSLDFLINQAGKVEIIDNLIENNVKMDAEDILDEIEKLIRK